MKIAVTGGLGFVGSHLVEKLLKSGHEVSSLDREPDPKKASAADVSGAQLLKCDILDTEKLVKSTSGSDCIVHLAASRLMKESMDKPFEYNRANIDGTVSVLEAARANGIRSVIFASSSAVYGNNLIPPQKEDSILYPPNPYGISKLTGEKYCHAYWENFGIQAVSLRLFNVYGPGQDKGAGAIMPFIDCAIRGANPVIYGSGMQSRDFIYVDDAVGAFLKCISLSRASKKLGGMSLNVGSGVHYSILEVLKEIEAISGTRFSIIRREKLAGDVKDTFADIACAKSVLNWSPEMALKNGIKKTYDWCRSMPRFRKK